MWVDTSDDGLWPCTAHNHYTRPPALALHPATVTTSLAGSVKPGRHRDRDSTCTRCLQSTPTAANYGRSRRYPGKTTLSPPLFEMSVLFLGAVKL